HRAGRRTRAPPPVPVLLDDALDPGPRRLRHVGPPVQHLGDRRHGHPRLLRNLRYGRPLAHIASVETFEPQSSDESPRPNRPYAAEAVRGRPGRADRGANQVRTNFDRILLRSVLTSAGSTNGGSCRRARIEVALRKLVTSQVRPGLAPSCCVPRAIAK